MRRYFTSGGSRKSRNQYYYKLDVRGGYGDQHTVDLKNVDVFWRTRTGDPLKLQRWGDRITAVELVSGESSKTAENPDWQLQNDIRGLRAIGIFAFVLIVIAGGAYIGWRQVSS